MEVRRVGTFIATLALLVGCGASAPTSITPTASAAVQSSAQIVVPSVSNCGNTSPRILLSFDDWPYPDTKRFETFVKILRSKRTSAFFFAINDPVFVARYPNYASYLRANGMWVGNHTVKHLDLTKQTTTRVRSEISGGTRSNVLRPPYGAHNTRVDAIAKPLGYRICTWTVDSGDTARGSNTVAKIRTTVLTYARPGSVVLMHLHTNAIYALSSIIDGIRAKGYELCRLQPPTSVAVPAVLPC